MITVKQVRAGVRVYDGLSRTLRKGTIAFVNRRAVHGPVFAVAWDGEQRRFIYALDDEPTAWMRDFHPLCKHCDQLQEDHADNGKCLYAPTSWEV